MPTRPANSVLQFIRKVAASGMANTLTDEQLLRGFLQGQDETAFAVLVRRHGPMVLAACRRVLDNGSDAEDAFQATFLVFVRKAGSIAKPELLGNWLYGVAYRTALRVRADASRRRALERQLATRLVPEPSPENGPNELHEALDEEINRLPAKYRVPVVMCYMEGRTIPEAARKLGCPEGTVGTRLARARQRLRARLVGRGLALSGAALAAVLAPSDLAAAVPPPLADATVRAALVFAAGKAAPAGAISPPVASLAQRMLNAMFLARLKVVAAVLLVLGAAGGVSLFTASANPARPTGVQHPNAPVRTTKKPAPPREEKETLQGKWFAVSMETDGDKLPQENLKKGKYQLFLDGNKGTCRWRDQLGVDVEFTFKLDPKIRPKNLELNFVAGVYKGETCLGIYEWTGDTLRVCFAKPEAPRPTAFDSKGGNQLLVFRRDRQP
jgi:RNA polymerase sigma factor (sigma-70 family)